MSENTDKKIIKPPSGHSSSNGKPRKKKITKRSTGAKSGKDTTGKPQKAKKSQDVTEEMPSGEQIRMEEIMNEPSAEDPSPAPKPKKRRRPAADAEEASFEHFEHSADKSSDDSADTFGQISWKKQASSIGVWMFSVILLALTFFPGESAWNMVHRFILGVLGFKAFLWAGLMILFGYLLTKQIDEDDILDILRPTAGIIVLSDVLGYILIQSDSYRNVYNEISFSFGQLLLQMISDGEKIGGSGLLAGALGEMLIFVAGKTGGAIISVILMTALVMVLSRTGPMELFNKMKRALKSLLDPEFYKKLFDGETDVQTVFETSELFDDKDSDSVEVSLEDLPEDSGISDLPPEEAPPSESGEGSLSEIVKAVSLKKKKKKLTKAEEIKAQSEEFSKEVNTGSSESDGNEKEYKFPTVRLLIPPKNTNSANDIQELTDTAEKLIRTLDEYGVKASISDISRGPTVTRYEIKPAPGVKINKITNLSNDIALRLAAQSIRIEAPIPGKAAVGIEIPNRNKQMVRIREIIGSTEFTEASGALTVALGKDIEGNIILCDLSKMPHLLIAGSTGSGKSVCVNSMLISLLYKYSPDEVRMVLIDPKSVEFDMYNGIPHLLVPVVCEPKKAAGALQWAVSEMLKRYTMLKEHGVRNIDGYNRLAEQTKEFEKLCRIVIVIDEMADLMIASPKEVEDAIARLAAMARAAGMYMVLATQRPSVDVITGTIKNNIPSRIALAVSSQVDSRTILDEGGAENLIGYGDMLYHPMGSSKHIRVQGCFVDDAEVDRVIRFVKQNGLAEYDDSIADEIERNSLDGSGDGSAEFEGKDEFFEKAVEVVTEAGQASTSMLQRRLGVGYARAGRIIDQLEEHGIIGPHEGSKPRAVLITRTQWMEMTMSRSHAGKNDPLVRHNSQFASQTLDAGHEEITARQSEFFNAENDDFFDDEAVYEDEPATVETEDDSLFDGDFSLDDKETEEQDIPLSASSESSSAEFHTPDDSADGIIDVAFEDEEQENAIVPKFRRSESAAGIPEAEVVAPERKDITQSLPHREAAAKAVEGKAGRGEESAPSSADHPREPAPETASKKPAKNAAAPRDFSVFFDDDEDNLDDFFAFSRSRKTGSDSFEPLRREKSPAHRETPPRENAAWHDLSAPDNRAKNSGYAAPVDVPPWEDGFIPSVSDILPEYGGDHSSPPTRKAGNVPQKTGTKNVYNDNDDNDSDDDLFDDVMSSPWIKKL